MSIKPRDKIMSLPANKTFAGRTETGRVGCKYCKSSDVVRWGKSDDKQRYICKSCGKTFLDDGAFPGMRTNARAISMALNLYFDGLSLSKIVKHLKSAYGIMLSRVAIWKWIQKYVPMVKKLVEKLSLDIAHSWHADETAVKIKGKLNWFWDGIDYSTRYIVMGMLAKNRDLGVARAFFKGAKANASGSAPELIVTDGAGAYRKGIARSFWRNILRSECKYIRKPGLRAKDGKLSNNVIERFHNTLKERIKIMRGFGSGKGAENVLDGFVIQYNFMRPHTTLDGKTPAEAAGLQLPIENGWGDFIQWATNESG